MKRRIFLHNSGLFLADENGFFFFGPMVAEKILGHFAKYRVGEYEWCQCSSVSVWMFYYLFIRVHTGGGKRTQPSKADCQSDRANGKCLASSSFISILSPFSLQFDASVLLFCNFTLNASYTPTKKNQFRFRNVDTRTHTLLETSTLFSLIRSPTLSHL